MPAAKLRRPGPGTFARKVLALLEQQGPQTARDLALTIRPRQTRRQPFANSAERRMWHSRQEQAIKAATAKVQHALDGLVKRGFVAPAAPRLAPGVVELIDRHGYAGALVRGAVEARVNGDRTGILDESAGIHRLAVDTLRAIATGGDLPDGAPLSWLARQDLIEPAGLRCLVRDLPPVPTPPQEAPMSRPKFHVCGRYTTAEATTETLHGRRFRVVRHLCETCGNIVREDRHELGGVGPKGAA